MKNRLSLLSITDRCRDEHEAYLLLEELRWGDPAKPVCPHCGHDKAYYLTPANGTTRVTRTGKTMSSRRVWKCAGCRKQFSVLTNTIFHGTKVPLRTWLLVMVQMCSAKNGISAREVERMHGVTSETAWHMLHRLRAAMTREPLAGMLTGKIVADESFIGGAPRNKHRQGKPRPKTGKGITGRGTDKTIVLSLVNRTTGEVRSRVIADTTGATLRKAIAEQVNMADSVLHTDAYMPYRQLGVEFQAHEWVDHSANEYVRYADGDHVDTNVAESYFSQLKRSIDGTHHNVSKVHLHRYLDEFDFRFNTRKLSDDARLRAMLGQVEGRRLTYKPLTGG